MLGLRRIEVAVVGLCVAAATDSLEDHRKRTTMSRHGAIRLRAVDRVAVVNDGVSRFEDHHDFRGAHRKS